jgi:uncharacterized membrane protein
MTDAGTPRPNTGPEPARRRPRWLLVALVVSLALNLVVVGSVAGAVWRFRAPPHWAGGAVTPNLLGYASTLPAPRRKELWDATAEERRLIRPFRREVRVARDETIKALIAEPFERQRFLAAQARQAEAENRARQAVQTLYVKIADGLTPEERRAFPRWREHRRHPSHNLLDEPDQQAREPPQK